MFLCHAAYKVAMFRIIIYRKPGFVKVRNISRQNDITCRLIMLVCLMELTLPMSQMQILQASVEIEITSSITSIDLVAFYSCDLFSQVTISDSVTTIARSAFFCYSLKEITIPGSVSKTENDAFNRCASLSAIDCLHRRNFDRFYYSTMLFHKLITKRLSDYFYRHKFA